MHGKCNINYCHKLDHMIPDEQMVILVKKLKYKRIDCTCGVAVMPTDPTPLITEEIKKLAGEFGLGFRISDTTVHPELVMEYHIRELPAVVVQGKAYPADVKLIKKALNDLCS